MQNELKRKTKVSIREEKFVKLLDIRNSLYAKGRIKNPYAIGETIEFLIDFYKAKIIK